MCRKSRRSSRVYPRVDGGTFTAPIPAATVQGLSPRGRGNRANVTVCCPVTRSIPAWTGEPRWENAPMKAWTVYPRVDGGTPAASTALAPLMGLSPRGRGNLEEVAFTGDRNGSIPAWTGEPLQLPPSESPATVYPRVDGGTFDISDGLPTT